MKKIISILLLLFVCSVHGQTLRLLHQLAMQQTGVAYDRATFVSNTKNSVGTNSSITLTKPADVENGDLLIIIVGNDDQGNVPQWDNSTLKPTGFTLIEEGGTNRSDSHVAAFWRIADGTEGATINVPAESADDYVGFYVHVGGTDQTTPIGTIGTPEVNTSNSLGINGVTGNQDDLGFYVLAFDGGDATFSVSGTDWVQTDFEAIGTFSGASAVFGNNIYSTTGGITATVGTVISDGKVGFQFRVISE